MSLKGLTFDGAFDRVADERNGDEQRDDFLRRSGGGEWKSAEAQSHQSLCYPRSALLFVLFCYVFFFRTLQ